MYYPQFGNSFTDLQKKLFEKTQTTYFCEAEAKEERPLATVPIEKPPFRAYLAIFAIGL